VRRPNSWNRAPSALENFALSVSDLCVSPRLSSAFSKRDARYVVDACQKDAEKVSDRPITINSFDVNAQRVRIGAEISHNSTSAKKSIGSFSDK